MTARNEFQAKVMVEIIRRATDKNGVPRCEICHGVAVGGEVHHIAMDAMQIDKSKPLTADLGQFVCKPCHKEITAKQAPLLAQAKRRERADLGVRTVPAKPMQSAPFPTTERAAKRQPKAALTPRALYR